MNEFVRINLANVLVLGCASGQILLPQHLSEQGLTQWEIGLIGSAFACSAILIRFRLGAWLVRWGQLPFYRLGALTVAFCQGCYAGVSPTAPVILLLRSLEGLALASYFTAIWSRVIDHAPAGQVGRTTGLFGISGLCAGAIGPWALEMVARASDYPNAFACAAATGLLGVLVGMSLKPDPVPSAPAPPPPGFWSIALSAPMRSTVLTSALFGMTLGVFNTFIVVYALRLGLAPVGPMFLLYTLSSVSVRLTGGSQSDRLPPVRIILPSLSLLSLACAALYLLKSYPAYPLLMLAGCLVGSAHGWIYPAISQLALLRAGASSNSASAVFTAWMDIGNLLGCAAAGALAHRYGHSLAFLAVSLSLAAGVAGIAWLEAGAAPQEDKRQPP